MENFRNHFLTLKQYNGSLTRTDLNQCANNSLYLDAPKEYYSVSTLHDDKALINGEKELLD